MTSGTDLLAQRRRRVSPGWVGVVPTALGLAVSVVIVYPLLRMLVGLFWVDGSLSTDGIAGALAATGLTGTLLDTVVVLGLSVPSALFIGSVLAWLNERTDARIGPVSGVMPIIPLLVPSIAVAIGWVLLMSPGAGVLNTYLRDLFGFGSTTGPFDIFTWQGLIILYVLELVPYAYLIMSAALRNLDPSLEQASRMAGAGMWRTLRRVTFPAVRPALMSSLLTMLTIGLTMFSIPAIVGGTAGIDVLSTRIVRLLTSTFPPETQQAVTLSMFALAIVAGAWVVQTRVLRNSRFAAIGGKGTHAARIRLGVWRWPARFVIMLYVVGCVALPVIGLMVVSLQPFWTASIDVDSFSLDNYRDVLIDDRATTRAITNSAVLGVVTATVVMLVAFLLALHARRRPSALARAIDGVVKLPSVLSHIVVAVGVLLAFGGPPFGLGGTIGILMLAFVIMFLPQASISAQAAVAQVGVELEEASHTSGATGWRTFREVLLPLAGPGLVSGWILVFVFTVGELTGSVLLAGTNTPTVGYVIFQEFTSGTYPTIAALALLMCVFTSATVFVVTKLTRGKGMPRA